MTSWIDFWNGNHSIYVNEKHKIAHSDKIFSDILNWLPKNNCSVLDFGCGEALYALKLNETCENLILVDTSENIRKKLQIKTSKQESIKVLSMSDCDALKNGSVDLILVNSVFQYLNFEQTEEALLLFHRVLKNSGKLIIADIIPKNLPVWADISSLLKFSFKNGFFFFALLGLFKTYLSDYRSLRRYLGLSLYSPEDFINLMSKSHFRAKMEPLNFGHNQNRFCFSAKKITNQNK